MQDNKDLPALGTCPLPRPAHSTSEGAQTDTTALKEIVSSHSTLSLLSLPDDLLLSVYEQVYEERYRNVTTEGSPRVAEILVNKRLFTLARPLWFSRLTITEEQLDRRLSGLLEDEPWRQHLRQLEIPLVPAHAHLSRVVLGRVHHLDHFSVSFVDEDSNFVHDIFLEAISSLPNLRHLSTRFNDYSLDTFSEVDNRFLDERSYSISSWTVAWDGSEPLYRDRYDDGELVGTHFADVSMEGYRELSWHKLESCKCGPVPDDSEPPVEALLDGLAATLKGEEDGTIPSIPLRHLALDLDPKMGWDQLGDGSSERLETLFRLLALTRVEHLEFTSVATIPKFQSTNQLSCIKLVRMSGSCTFRHEARLELFSRFLSLFPFLAQLHLIGDNFFEVVGTSANKISELETFDLIVRYPELHSLLFVLIRTKVKIFTYRGQDERRELRWTRTDGKDDFERECWTL